MLDVCLRNGLMGWDPRTDGEPSICELIHRVRELRAEETTTVDEISPPGDSSGIAERAIMTVEGLVVTTKAVVEENVLEGRDAHV